MAAASATWTAATAPLRAGAALLTLSDDTADGERAAEKKKGAKDAGHCHSCDFRYHAAGGLLPTETPPTPTAFGLLQSRCEAAEGEGGREPRG